MQKMTMATFALLYSSQVNALHHLKTMQAQDLIETVDSAELVNLDEAEYADIHDTDFVQMHSDEPEMMETNYLETDASADFSPTSCKAGIERMSGHSNSVAAWNAAQSAGKLWEDPEFGADDSSLNWAGAGFGSKVSVPSGGPWKRPSEMAGEGWTSETKLYGSLGYPAPQGVSQGGLSDCWFVAAASALAEDPEKIKDVIYNQQYSGVGMFRFKFWVVDKWVWVNIDDRLPARKWGSAFRPWATGRSPLGAWWMPLLEKAYAKLDQNYDRIAWGNGIEGLRTLTGKPANFLYHQGKSSSQLATVHKSWAAKNYPATASCCNNVGGVAADGLTSGHAYSFLDLQNVGGHMLAKMRNPWGSEGYKGKWSDKDPNWTAAMKAQVNLVDANDGIFWMPYENMLSYFSKVDVGYTDAVKSQIIPYSSAARTTRYKVVNKVSQTIQITAETYSERHYPRAAKCQKNSMNVLMRFKDQSGKLVEPLQPYSFIKSWGFGTVGKYAGELPAGSYILEITNQGGTKADLAVQFSASKQSPSLYNA